MCTCMCVGWGGEEGREETSLAGQESGLVENNFHGCMTDIV